jgi:hypothetical protein
MSDYFLLSSIGEKGVLNKIYKKEDLFGTQSVEGESSVEIRKLTVTLNIKVNYSTCNSDISKCTIDILGKYATYYDLLEIAAKYNKNYIDGNSITKKQFNNLLQNIGTITSYYANDTPTQYESGNPSSLLYSKSEFNNVYSQVQNQLIELKRTDNSIYQEKQKELDMAIYANLMWTVLATSIIYYIFIEL